MWQLSALDMTRLSNKAEYSVYNDVCNVSKANVINELCDVRDGESHLDGFDRSLVNSLIEDLRTS